MNSVDIFVSNVTELVSGKALEGLDAAISVSTKREAIAGDAFRTMVIFLAGCAWVDSIVCIARFWRVTTLWSR